MAVRLVCQACGKRLKLPDGIARKRSAKCPKCLSPVDLTAAVEASAYLPTVAVPGMAVVSTTSAPSRAEERKPPALLGEDDPLPYPDQKPAHPPTTKADSRPPHPKPVPPPLPSGAAAPSKPSSSPPPLPSGGLRPPLAAAKGASASSTAAHAAEEVLSLDDDDQPGDTPVEPPPFRVPVRVLADSLRQVGGRCFAVLVPHGMFLESEPMKPFLYIPVRTRAESPAPGEIIVTLPDRRAVTLRIETRYARPLAKHTVAFLAGDRPVPAAIDYRRKWWMLWAALIFALGLAGGPIALSQIANQGLEFGLQVGAGFALAGLLANTFVVLFSRWSVPGQLILMAGVCLFVTGMFLFGATAYMAGRQRAIEEVKSEPPPQPSLPPLPPPTTPGPPEPPPTQAPSHLDRAKKFGASGLEDGPADVSALALAPDANTLAIGYADGTVRLWPLDQPTYEAMLPGPKADGPITRVQFDAKNRFVFAYTSTGVIASPKGIAPMVMAKIPGTQVGVAPEPDGERIRFAAVRGNVVQHRTLAVAFIANPPVPKGKAGPYAIPNPNPKGGDEVIPAGNAADPQKPGGGPGPTFLAWSSASPPRLFAGQADGTVTVWSSTMRPEPQKRDHKGPVKAWAACYATGDFATADDTGGLAIWPAKGGKPAFHGGVLSTPITGLSFNPTGSRLAIIDTTGWLVIWDVPAAKAVIRVKPRPTGFKAMAYGPNDDVLLLASGKTVEVWSLPELLKQ